MLHWQGSQAMRTVRRRQIGMAPPRVFVSHSHQDDAFTGRLVNDLIAAGADVWVDVAGVGADDFQERINQALMTCAWFVLVLTPSAIQSPWVKMEVHAAIRLKVQGRMQAVIQLLAEPVSQADIPPTWGTFSHFDATRDYTAARNRVLGVLGLPPFSETPEPAPSPQQPPNASSVRVPSASPPAIPSWLPPRLASRGFAGRTIGSTEVILPLLCDVPAGEFLMGSDKQRDSQAYDDELPQHQLTLPAYQIGLYPMTVAEYACAVRARAVREPPKGYLGTDWQTQLQRLDHPVTCVSWQDALAYVRWLAQTTDQPWRLPTEAEWEKAARWDPARQVSRLYPWGDQWDKARANTADGGPSTTTPVGAYADRGDVSPYGAHDLAGNVWEWTSSVFKPYPYSLSDGRETSNSTGNRVLRGGSWGVNARYARAAYRLDGRAVYFDDVGGFRLALAAPAGS